MHLNMQWPLPVASKNSSNWKNSGVGFRRSVLIIYLNSFKLQKNKSLRFKKLDYTSRAVSGGFYSELELREAKICHFTSTPLQSPSPFSRCLFSVTILFFSFLSFPHTNSYISCCFFIEQLCFTQCLVL